MKKYLILFVLAITLAACTQSARVEDLSTNLQSLIPSPTIMTTTPTPLASDAAVLGTQSATTPAPTSTASANAKKSTYVTIQTDKGDITVLLYPEDAPKTVANFVAKAKSGYYAKLVFHRVEDWVIQGGDPQGTGMGGGKMPTELSNRPFKVGSLGVARGGQIEVSNDSQFFICTTDCAWLTGAYTNFGEVVSGMDVAKSIAVGDTIQKMRAEVK